MDNLLITGASSGIGKSLALYFAGRYRVLAGARRLDQMRKSFSERKDIVPFQLDLERNDHVSEVVDGLIKTYGPIRYLINNAGVLTRSEVLSLTRQQMTRDFIVNVFAPTQILQKVLPGMIQMDFGRVIHVTSGAPLNCSEGFSVYSASKAALNAFTVTAAKEHMKYNIKINLMSPGPCKTEMTPEAALDPNVCHPTADYLLSLDAQGPTGKFFWMGHEAPLFPDLGGIDWLAGRPGRNMRKVL